MSFSFNEDVEIVNILLASGKITKEEAERKIEIYKFLSDINNLCLIMDSAVFNNIIAAYAFKALEMAECGNETQTKVLSQLYRIFDEYTSGEVINEFQKG